MDATDYAQDRADQLLAENLQHRKTVPPYRCETCHVSIPSTAKIKRWCSECADEQMVRASDANPPSSTI
jgi:predicted RNA-binding Zn-ribbon protein involved in translation (DUF1610 family)